MSKDIEDITAIFDHYRVSARSIWNTAFWPDQDFHEWDFIDAFDEIQRTLFDSLVFSKLDMEFPAEDLFRKPVPFLHIVAQSESGCPIMIQNPRAPMQTGYWDHPVKEIPKNGIEMHFIESFDWDRMAVQDMRYYRVNVARFDQHPDVVGREALIETHYARVFFVAESKK
jgi:hypothetical protein